MKPSSSSYERAKSIALVGLFVLTAIANVLVSSGTTVPLDNTEIANSHPTYLVPSGSAFSIWGVIYALVGIYTVLQALPGQLEDKHYTASRPWAGLSLLTNIFWLYLFSFELYWVSLMVIATYGFALFMALESFEVDYLDASMDWKRKIGSCAFSANAAWVTVATWLQVGGNLLDEGWQPSPDFCTGVLLIVTCWACFNVYRRCDGMYAFISAWALGWIINNQGDGSDFGTAKAICTQTCIDKMNICSMPNGKFYELCRDFAGTNFAGKNVQVVAKSPKVVKMAWVCIAIVLVALVAGLIRGIIARRAAKESVKEYDEMDGKAYGKASLNPGADVEAPTVLAAR